VTLQEAPLASVVGGLVRGTVFLAPMSIDIIAGY